MVLKEKIKHYKYDGKDYQSYLKTDVDEAVKELKKELIGGTFLGLLYKGKDNWTHKEVDDLVIKIREKRNKRIIKIIDKVFQIKEGA